MKNLLYLALLAPMASYSIELTVNATCGGVLTGNQNDPNTPCGAMTQEIRNYDELPDVPIDTYAAGISDANGFAIKGQTSDYSDNFSLFSFKGGLGVGFKGDVDKVQDNPGAAEGIGLASSVSVGLNLDMLPVDKIGPVDFSKLDLFVSAMSYNVDNTTDETSMEGDISSFGVFTRYRIIDGVTVLPGYLLEWGGIHLHTGFQTTSMNLKMTQNFQNQTVESNGATAEFQDGAAVFDLSSRTSFIPVELSTFVRVGYIVTMYGGAGFDYNLGNTDIDLSASGNVLGTGAASGYSATVAANESGSGGPEATNFRGFAGFQFNIPFARVYAQVNKSIGSEVIGANVGLKVLW